MSLVDELRAVLGASGEDADVDRVAHDLRRLADRHHTDEVPAHADAAAAGPAVDDGVHWSQDDVWVIAYPDHFQAPGRRPLAVLADALDTLAPGTNGVHVLPCYPWSSDDGYAVVDPLAIDPAYGTWDDVRTLARRRRLMLDAVVNHVSSRSRWFEAFLAGDRAFVDGFVTADPDADLSAVVRPRDHPLLTPFATERGTQHVWTTFSTDQVDVDVTDPRMLQRVVDVLLAYAATGAAAIRLDAVGFLVKQLGTSCIHLPETHAAVRLFRAVLDRHHADLLLVTETNVPHDENVSYLGVRGGPREAQAVYLFSLPPLVLHTMHTGDATALAAWARSIDWPTDGRRTQLTFLASHDGIGLRPAEGLLTTGQVDGLIRRVEEVGGVVNTRATPDGPRPYELCSTWFDAVALGDEERGIAHHLASHAILLLLPGIALVYAGSLLGSSNDHAAHRATGSGRALNRRRFTDPDDHRTPRAGTRAARVNDGLRALVALRRSHPSFHPDAALEVAPARPGTFRFWRGRGVDRLLVEVNVGLAPVDGVPVGGWRVTDASGCELSA